MHRSLRLLLLPALILACGQEPSGEPTPLIDGVHAPLVLTEQAQLDKPPAYSGNRFLAGWWPGRRSRDPSQLNVADRVVLEAVFLDGRERRLATRMDVLEAAPDATFGVRVGGVELPPPPLARDAEVPLPGGLPLGRLPIELDLRGARVRIEAAGFGHAWPPGEVQLSATAILQGGYSAVDFPRRQVGPATLVGTFEPPAEPEPDQRFAVILETDRSEPDTAFEWRGDKGAGRARRLRLDLPDGFLRIRLLAQVIDLPGPIARWKLGQIVPCAIQISRRASARYENQPLRDRVQAALDQLFVPIQFEAVHHGVPRQGIDEVPRLLAQFFTVSLEQVRSAGVAPPGYLPLDRGIYATEIAPPSGVDTRQ